MSLIGEFIALGFGRFVLLVAVTVIAWFIAFGIKKWFSKGCRWEHDKEYLRLELLTNWRCNKIWGHELHTEKEWWATKAIWVCKRAGCNEHGFDCFGTSNYWIIEHGQVVRDTKAFANPPKMESPAVQMARKTKEIGAQKLDMTEMMKKMLSMQQEHMCELRLIHDIAKDASEKKKEEDRV